MLLPIFFLPFIYDAFGLGKSGFLVLTGAFGIILWILELLLEKKNELKYSKWLWWVLILFVWSGVSFWRMTKGGQARSLTSVVGMGGLIGLVMWSFLWLQVRSKEETKKQFLFLTISGLIVGLVSVLVFMIPSSKFPVLWPKNNALLSISEGWTLVGSMLGEAVLFLVLFIGWIKRLLEKLKEKDDFSAYFKEALAVAFFGLMLLLDVYRLIKTGWVYLDFNSSWVIAVESLKTNAIFGVGPGNFVEAFSRLRPASFNLTSLWTSTFGLSGIGILNMWTELGVVGLVIVMAMARMIWRSGKSEDFLQIVLLGLITLVLPPTFLVLILLFWMLSSNLGEVKTAKLTLTVGEKGFNVMPYLVSLILLGAVGFGGYKMTRLILGDYYWRTALVSASKNDGSGAYNNEIKAIGMNPNLADYRAVYSQTNLALAESILGTGDSNTITAENKEKASTLIQQAVREAQAAVNLDPKVSAYWTNLGSVYSSLVGVVDNALSWSVQSYQQAVVIDPVNPSIYMQLGSMAYGSKDYASAERYFEEAVTNKNDYANAWYNWAYAAKQQNQLQLAVNRLQQAVSLVPANSDDYTKAKEELDSWQKEYNEAVAKYNEQLKQQEATATATPTPVQKTSGNSEPLTTPEPLPTVGKEEKVNVPAKDLEPPEN